MELAIRFDEILQTDGIFERLCIGLINDRRYADYFAKAAELEALATKICEFPHALVLGLLQTEEYIADKVDGRMDRSRILKDATRPVYWAIPHENSLRVPVGGPLPWPGSWITSRHSHASERCWSRSCRTRPGRTPS